MLSGGASDGWVVGGVGVCCGPAWAVGGCLRWRLGLALGAQTVTKIVDLPNVSCGASWVPIWQFASSCLCAFGVRSRWFSSDLSLPSVLVGLGVHEGLN